MSSFSIKYSCGHTHDKQLYGPMAQRERYIAWAERAGDCADCVKKQAGDRIAALEQEHGLSELAGSPKQITWARKLRHNKMQDMLHLLSERRKKAEMLGKLDRYEERAAILLQGLAEKNHASWWIDNQHTGATRIAQEIYEATR